MFDSSAIAAAELLSHFGKNTAVRIDHKYGHNELRVVSARTGNVLSVVAIYGGSVTNTYCISNVATFSLEEVARVIMGQKNFPRPRNMKRSWSPIRLSANAQAMMDSDSGIRFA
jgi:hypothetical protein